MSTFLGLDIGTTSVSLIAIDERGRVVDSITKTHQAQKTNLPAYYSEQSLPRLLQTAQACVADLISRIPNPPTAIGLTGQMHGFCLLDQQLQPVTDLINWQDHRCEQPGLSDGKTFLQELHEKLHPQIRNDLGCSIRRGYAVANYYAMQQLKQIPLTAVKMADITGFFSAQLTGAAPCIDPTFAASWGIYHLKSGHWAEEILQVAGLETKLLPQLVASGSVAGWIRPDQSHSWHLPEGIPVFVGIGDNQAAVLGSIENAEQELLINIGTGGQVAWIHQDATPTAEIEIRPYLDGKFVHVGAGVTGGDAYAWFMQTVAGWIAEMGFELTEAELYRRLEMSRQNCQNLPDDDKLICLPFFKGTRVDPNQRGEFQNIGRNNFQLGHLADAILCGIVDQLMAVYERSSHHLPELKQVVTAGNFFQHHPWTLGRISSRWGLPVRESVTREQAAYGAARLALESSRRGGNSWLPVADK